MKPWKFYGFSGPKLPHLLNEKEQIQPISWGYRMSLNSDLSEVYELYVILVYVIIISRVLNLLSVHHPEDAGKKKKSPSSM